MDDTPRMFQDVEGIDPVRHDGDRVARVDNRTENGHSWIAPIFSESPIWRTDGTLGWLEFDGRDRTHWPRGAALILCLIAGAIAWAVALIRLLA